MELYEPRILTPKEITVKSVEFPYGLNEIIVDYSFLEIDRIKRFESITKIPHDCACFHQIGNIHTENIKLLGLPLNSDYRNLAIMSSIENICKDCPNDRFKRCKEIFVNTMRENVNDNNKSEKIYNLLTSAEIHLAQNTDCYNTFIKSIHECLTHFPIYS